MRNIKIYLISLCIIITACDDASSSRDCPKDGNCPETTPICNPETGKCEENPVDEGKCKSDCPGDPPAESKCKSDADCANDAHKCDITVGKCVECLRNNDCTDNEKPRCIPETGKCEISTYGKKSCQNDNDCTDSFYSKCNTDIGECTSPCTTSNDCKLCKDDEKCLETDVPVCNNKLHLCESYSDCTINSSGPCYTRCSADNDEYIAWLNGNLINQKCKNNSCSISEKKVGVEPDTCEVYSTPPESCNPETSTNLCSADGKSIWTCDSATLAYYDVPCDAETEHCVQCQNRAACIPIENCSQDSNAPCNPVCNAKGDSYYIWTSDTVKLHICPQGDCINICGTAECKDGTGYHEDEYCESSLKYCASDGAFAFTCEDNHTVQKKCKNNDCVYDADSNEITSCTPE